jgi:hypothetical protein
MENNTPKTAREFNEKYRDYIEYRFHGCDLENPKALAYLDREFQEFIKYPNFKFCQIKPKFNWFCFYCTVVPKEKVEQIEENLEKIYRNG